MILKATTSGPCTYCGVPCLGRFSVLYKGKDWMLCDDCGRPYRPTLLEIYDRIDAKIAKAAEKGKAA